jgi:hypothetical protein
VPTLIALGMDMATEKSSHTTIGMAPNMCITPAAPSPLPMPYPIQGDTGMLAQGTDKVSEGGGGKKLLTLKGKTMMCAGNEAGVGTDIITHTIKGKAFGLVGVPVVLIEGAPQIVTGMPGMMNAM